MIKKMYLLIIATLLLGGCWRYNDDDITKQDKNIVAELQGKKAKYYFKKTNCKLMSIWSSIFHAESIVCDYKIYEL